MDDSTEYVSAFPLPPRHLYEKLGVEEIEALTPPEISLKDLTSFGIPVSTTLGLRDLGQLGLRQLYDSEKAKSPAGIKDELKTLNAGLKRVVNEFLQGACNENYTVGPNLNETEIVVHFQNMHHLLNLLRAHEAVHEFQKALKM